MRKLLGLIGEHLIGKVVEADSQVEKALIEEMEIAFQEFGIEAKILWVQRPKLDALQAINVPIMVRKDKEIYLTEN